jgi:antirestriction protein ArdC
MTSTKTKFDAYEAVTATIIKALEAGTVPWRKPWGASGTLPLSLSTKKAYRGINPLLLSLSALEGGYTSPWWGTYKRISEMGGQVRKGEKSTMVTLWKRIKITETDEVTGEKKPKIIFMLRVYSVFNAEQADWAEGKEPVNPATSRTQHDPIEAAEAIVAGYPDAPRITRTASDQAFYVPTTDEITVPEIGQYAHAEEFYSTLFHEMGHSTGHPSRLDRPNITSFSHFGDEKYSKEELCAEMTAAFLCAQAGIETTLDNSAAYLASWLRVLKADHKLIVQAAAQAQKAAEHVLGIAAYTEEEVSADAA